MRPVVVLIILFIATSFSKKNYTVCILERFNKALKKSNEVQNIQQCIDEFRRTLVSYILPKSRDRPEYLRGSFLMAESGRVINSEVKHCMDEKKVPSYPQQMVVNVELIEAVLNVINEETARICNERNASTTS